MNLKKTFILPIILIVIITILSVMTLLNTDEDVKPRKISEVLNQDEVFLEKTTNGEHEYYVGETTSSNYTVYVERGEYLSHVIKKTPKDFEFSDLDEYFNKYGQPSIQAYGPGSEKSGFISYVWLENGLIVVGHPLSKLVFEVWEINPNLTSEQFWVEFSSTFSKTKPTPPEHDH